LPLGDLVLDRSQPPAVSIQTQGQSTELHDEAEKVANLLSDEIKISGHSQVNHPRPMFGIRSSCPLSRTVPNRLRDCVRLPRICRCPSEVRKSGPLEIVARVLADRSRSPIPGIWYPGSNQSFMQLEARVSVARDRKRELKAPPEGFSNL